MIKSRSKNSNFENFLPWYCAGCNENFTYQQELLEHQLECKKWRGEE